MVMWLTARSNPRNYYRSRICVAPLREESCSDIVTWSAHPPRVAMSIRPQNRREWRGPAMKHNWSVETDPSDIRSHKSSIRQVDNAVARDPKARPWIGQLKTGAIPSRSGSCVAVLRAGSMPGFSPIRRREGARRLAFADSRSRWTGYGPGVPRGPNIR